MLGTARLKLIKQFLLCFVVFLKIGGWVDVFATDPAASYSPTVHENSCKIYKLKLNNYVAGFCKTLLLSLSCKLFFSFFCSLVFGIMGCKKGILVFTSFKLHAPTIIKYVFVLQK